MSYDKRTRVSFTVPVSTSTFTASDHVLTASTVFRYAFARACTLLGAAASVTTAGQAKSPQCVLMQATTNTGVAVPTSHTAGAKAAAAAAVTGGVDFAAGDQVSVNVISTGTASAAETAPVWEVELDIAEKFS